MEVIKYKRNYIDYIFQLVASSFARTIIVIINYSSTSKCLYLILNIIEKSILTL